MSALIFVAVAVAWAVYLVPKALRHHEEDAASRTIEQISDRARVLARRDAVTARTTRLMTQKDAPKDAPAEVPVEAEAPVDLEVEVEHTVTVTTETVSAGTPARAVPAPARRAAARRAAQRRRRVLLTLLFVLTATVATVIGGYLEPVWIAVPAAIVVGWLVLCRLMVRRERSRRTTPVRRAVTPTTATDAEADVPVATTAQAEDLSADDETGEIPAVAEEAVNEGPQPGTWAPVPVTLPTYVAKAQASRSVRTIDLDSTGVWSSGRNAGDSELAREAEAQDRNARAERDQQATRRVVGD